MPLGADVNSAVYRATAGDQKTYFVKLRRGAFAEIGVTLPDFLHAQGIPQIIAPRPTLDGQLWAPLADFRLILYPFMPGRNGFELVLSAAQWADFGAALKRIHTLQLPEALARPIPCETYTPQFRESVRTFLERAKGESFTDRVAMKAAALLLEQETVIRHLLQRAEDLASLLQAQPDEFVLCHTDAHAGNILVDDEGALYIVDWDAPLFAPKERDLMFIGGAQGYRGVTPQEEERLFYQGYGETQIDPAALVYYRYERIIQDIAAFCEQLLDTTQGGDDREQSFRYLASNFTPGNTIEVAYHSDKSRLTLCKISVLY
jgi:spectinomycin phosphotransferase